MPKGCERTVNSAPQLRFRFRSFVRRSLICQREAGFAVSQRSGSRASSVSTEAFGSCVKTSRSQAQGSTWFALALATRLKSTAARRPAFGLPTNSQMV